MAMLAMALPAIARASAPLELPANSRVMGMGGAFVAVADDPQAGLLNPAGVRLLKQVAYDLGYSFQTSSERDHLTAALANPGSDHGGAFGTGIYTQGVSANDPVRYYVPYSGASWSLTSTTRLGLVGRFPYRRSRLDTLDSRWSAVGDLTGMQEFSEMRLGFALERALGGDREFIQRRLRWGAAWRSESSGFSLSYEWRGSEIVKRYHFRRASSHLGSELALGDHALIRAGYIWDTPHRVSFGSAVGNLGAGWRLEFAWDVPPSRRGVTRWSVGLGYRI